MDPCGSVEALVANVTFRRRADIQQSLVTAQQANVAAGVPRALGDMAVDRSCAGRDAETIAKPTSAMWR